MSGRHRKPSSTHRIARSGVFGMMVGAPMLLSGAVLPGTALAAPPGGLAPEKRHAGDERLRDRDDYDGVDHDGVDHDGVDHDEHYADTGDAHSDGGSGDSDGSDHDGDSGDDSDSGDDGDGDHYAGDEEERTGHGDADYEHADYEYSDGDDRDRSDRSSRGRADRADRSARHRRDDEDRETASSGGGRYSYARWDRLAACESSENWDANTGNGYRGGLQFSDSTWRGYGGHRYAPSADQASREEQIAVAEKVQREQGWNAWPSCSHQLGYT